MGKIESIIMILIACLAWIKRDRQLIETLFRTLKAVAVVLIARGRVLNKTAALEMFLPVMSYSEGNMSQ